MKLNTYFDIIILVFTNYTKEVNTLSEYITKDSVIIHKKKALKNLNSTMEAFINNPNPSYLKKANLLSYWIEDYSKYLLNEKNFDYSNIMKFKRGDIVNINFGFNVGSEHGGLHFSVVLDNDNKQSSPVITVVPLSSGTEDKVYKRDVFLGSELYEKLFAKFNKLSIAISQEADKQGAEYDKLIAIINNLEGQNVNTSTLQQLNEMIIEASNKLEVIKQEVVRLKKYEKDILKLNSGTIALMEQITTVSKMRIYKPKSSQDLLYGVKLSDGAMNKINEQLKNLYVYCK